MTLDADVVRGRCQEIEQSLGRLEAIRPARSRLPKFSRIVAARV